MRNMSRGEWIAGAFDALCSGGIDGLRVEPLAKRLGVTKGSFYHHFANRRALHLAVLSEWERIGTGQVIDTVAHAALDPGDQLRTLAYEAMMAHPTADAIEVAIRAWATKDQIVASAVSRVDDRRLEFVVDLLRCSGFSAALASRRAKLLYRIMIGEFTWSSAGGPKMSKQEIDEAVDLVLSSDGLDFGSGPQDV